jgi:hypothetical protein
MDASGLVAFLLIVGAVIVAMWLFFDVLGWQASGTTSSH